MVLEDGERGGAGGRPPSLQGALTVRKYRAYHVASAPRRVTPMTQSGTRRQPASMKRTSARKEREGSEGMWMRGRNESSSRSKWRKKADSPKRKRRRTERRRENEKRERERERGRWYAKETYVPTRTPQDASCHGRASGPPMPRS